MTVIFLLIVLNVLLLALAAESPYLTPLLEVVTSNDLVSSETMQSVRDFCLGAEQHSLLLVLVLSGLGLYTALSQKSTLRVLQSEIERSAKDHIRAVEELKAQKEQTVSVDKKLAEQQQAHESVEAQNKALKASLAAAQAQVAELSSPAARNEGVDEEIVHFISLLQEKGRFVDFMLDDISAYGDQQVGAAARVVHQGCTQVLKKYFEITPVHEGAEGTRVTITPTQDSSIRVLGGAAQSSAGSPSSGTLVHKGWKVTGVSLPRKVRKTVESTASVVGEYLVAPAEIQAQA